MFLASLSHSNRCFLFQDECRKKRRIKADDWKEKHDEIRKEKSLDLGEGEQPWTARARLRYSVQFTPLCGCNLINQARW